MALLYPFTWQHVFIPVLPASLIDMCCAPMPFVVGVLSSYLPEVMKLPLDDVLMVDLDQVDSFFFVFFYIFVSDVLLSMCIANDCANGVIYASAVFSFFAHDPFFLFFFSFFFSPSFH